MLNSAKRRISALERMIELPITAERFFASVEQRVRLTGASFDEVFRSSLISLSDENLDRIKKELTQRVFGAGHGGHECGSRNSMAKATFGRFRRKMRWTRV
jgi:hypothetical protein